MNKIGTKEIETDRLILKVPTMKEQKRLWEILMIPDVNRYYLGIDKKFRDNLLSWDKQESFYKEKVENATDSDKFEWSIFLKGTNEVIGQINSHVSSKENYGIHDDNVMSVGWFIDPKYQGQGYATEAALAMIKYMFEEVGITSFKTSACVNNPASWKVMEKIGFIRNNEKTLYNEYTFVANPVESYIYELTYEQYLSSNKRMKR